MKTENVVEEAVRDPQRVIKDALRDLEQIGERIESSRKRHSEKGAQIPLIAGAVDLEDSKAMAELGRLYLEVAILPARISVCEESYQKAEAYVKEVCDGFISNVLCPKVREQEVRARAKAKAALKSHFPAGNELDRAVETSSLVRGSVANQMWLEGNPLGGPIAYAGRILAAWDAVKAFDGNL